MAKGRKVRASRAAQGQVEFSHFPPAVHFDLIRKQAVVIPADRKSGSAGMPRPISYAVFCLKKKTKDIVFARFDHLTCLALGLLCCFMSVVNGCYWNKDNV